MRATETNDYFHLWTKQKPHPEFTQFCPDEMNALTTFSTQQHKP